jgi:hypothetical protein
MVRMATADGSRSGTRRRTFPVTVRQLPVVRCDLCDQTVAHPPGQAADALTKHYQREHPSALPSR